MFGLGMPEILVILLIALLFFGASRLPEIGRSLGKAITEFKKGMNGFTEDFEEKSKDEKKDNG